jgi:hypothetical protein
MSWRSALETALYSKLTTAPGTVVWGARVYSSQAPVDSPDPFVVFQAVGGGDLNESPSRIVDVVYQIECVSRVKATARNGADYLGTALHDAALSITGWGHIATTQGRVLDLVENDKQVQWWRVGADFRIRMSK